MSSNRLGATEVEIDLDAPLVLEFLRAFLCNPACHHTGDNISLDCIEELLLVWLSEKLIYVTLGLACGRAKPIRLISAPNAAQLLLENLFAIAGRHGSPGPSSPRLSIDLCD